MNNNHTDNLYYPATSPTPPGQISPSDCIPCPRCGETAFLLRRSDRKFVCARCGNHMEGQAKPVTTPGRVVPHLRKPVKPPIQIGYINSEQVYIFLCRNGSVKAYTNDIRRAWMDVCDSDKYGVRKVRSWSNITAIAAGGVHAVGLRSDGTVLAVGSNAHGKCDVQDWTDITAITSTWNNTMGLCKDGTVKVAGADFHGEHNVRNWTGITAISSSAYHTVGLCSNGTVKTVGWNYDGVCNVQDWSNIIAIDTSDDSTVGLCADGTVKAVGRNIHGECNVQDWTDIIAIAACSHYTVGLRKDGTIRFAGNTNNMFAGKNMLAWQNVVSLLKIDGRNIAAMQSNGSYLCNDPDLQQFLNKLPR